jgi:hypothetical protein
VDNKQYIFENYKKKNSDNCIMFYESYLVVDRWYKRYFSNFPKILEQQRAFQQYFISSAFFRKLVLRIYLRV